MDASPMQQIAADKEYEGNAFWGPAFSDSTIEERRNQYMATQFSRVSRILQSTLARRDGKQLEPGTIANLSGEQVLDINAALYGIEMHNIPHDQGIVVNPKNPCETPIGAYNLGRTLVCYFDLEMQKDPAIANLLRTWKKWDEQWRSGTPESWYVPRDINSYSYKHIGDGSMKPPSRWWSIYHVLDCFEKRSNIITGVPFHKLLMGVPMSSPTNAVDRIVEARRRMCYTIFQFERLKRKDRVLMTNDMVLRAVLNCKGYNALKKLVKFARRVKESRLNLPPGKHALEKIVSDPFTSHEFGQVLWPYLDRTCSYPLMLACKALRAFGLEHRRQNVLGVVGIDRKGNVVSGGGFPFHGQGPNGENLVRPGKNIRFQLKVSNTTLQRVVVPGTCATNETEELRDETFVFEKRGSAVSDALCHQHLNHKHSLVEVTLVNDDEKFTRAGNPQVPNDVYVMRKGDPTNEFLTDKMPVIRLDVKKLSGEDHQAFRLRFSLNILHHLPETSRTGKKSVHVMPWVVYSDPFYVVSKLDTETAKANKRARDVERCKRSKQQRVDVEAQRAAAVLVRQ